MTSIFPTKESAELTREQACQWLHDHIGGSFGIEVAHDFCEGALYAGGVLEEHAIEGRDEGDSFAIGGARIWLLGCRGPFEHVVWGDDDLAKLRIGIGGGTDLILWYAPSSNRGEPDAA
jgi:hypothetical protein